MQTAARPLARASGGGIARDAVCSAVRACGAASRPAAAHLHARCGAVALARTPQPLRVQPPQRARRTHGRFVPAPVVPGDTASAAAARGGAIAASGADAAASSPAQWAHFAAALAAFLVTDRLLVNAAAANGITFPPPLLGMFALIAALAATEARGGTPAVDSVAAAAAPAVDWIGRWLPLFYVPSLVMIPLALQALPGALVAKVLGLLLVGWAATLGVAAATTVQIRKFTKVELLPAPPAAKGGGFTNAHRVGWAAVGAASLLVAAVAPPEPARLAGQLFLLASTIGGYLAGSAAPAGVQRIVHPLIACAAATNAAAAVLGAVNGAGWEGVLRTYLTKGKGGAPWGAGDLLMAFLHSVILSFGFRVFAQRALMRRHFAEIGGCVLASSIFGMFFTAAAGALLGLPSQLSLALAPRSVTVALALPIAALLGASADASVTAATVVLTGLIGANFAQPLLSALGFRDPVVRGLATAASAHGLGTAALAAKEPEALPVAALAYATMGIVSSLLVALPQFRALLALVAGAA